MFHMLLFLNPKDDVHYNTSVLTSYTWVIAKKSVKWLIIISKHTINFYMFSGITIMQLLLVVMDTLLWDCRGFPFWLHDIPDISYRTDNEPFKVLLLLILDSCLTSSSFAYNLFLINFCSSTCKILPQK